MNLPLQTQGTRGSRDERGLISITIPWIVASLNEVLTVGEANVLGLPETRREFSDHEAGKFLVNITYEGSQSDEGNTESFEWDTSLAEEPIESHPLIETLKSNYGGTVNSEGRITFPEKISGKSTGSSAGLGGGVKSRSDKNPLFGLSTYLVTKAVFRHTYLRRTFPESILDRIGTVQHHLPGGFPTPQGRNWLVMAPKIARRGNLYEISEELMLSAPGGWPEAVYQLIQR